MFRILLADDEGIMIESLKTIIKSQYGEECEIESAKTGRVVVELAESFRPDIVFMDIQMPGINGIQAMKEIRKFNDRVLFIVVTAYDKFTYAQESINLGVMDYLTKPVNKQRVLDVLMRAMKIVEDARKRRSDDLKIREKLETVIPIIESGYINTLLLQGDSEQDNQYYKDLLDIKEDFGYVMIVQFGEPDENGEIGNVVGASVKAQSFYNEFREIVKEFFDGIIGPVMANKIIIYIPFEAERVSYEMRSRIIERSRSLVRKLDEHLDVKFRIGIGAVRRMQEMKESYQEALKAIQVGKGSVLHIKDLPIISEYVGEYPATTEKRIFQSVAKSNIADTLLYANEFYDWMLQNYRDCIDDIRIKVLEFVITAEKEAFQNGGMMYGFRYRKDYLAQIMSMEDYEHLRTWYLERLTEVCHNMATCKEEQSESVVSRAKSYIKKNFSKDISLDDVSKEVDISPYYFSKLFKEESGQNFIEYLTQIRIDNAKELLKNAELSIKEICIMSGYSDPNYFSRIFKKYMEVTPSEYREKTL